MTVRDAQATQITFDGTAVGGFVSANLFQGVAREVVHRPLNSDTTCVLAGQPDHGRCVITVYRDDADAGQVKLRSSLANREVRTAVVTYSDGSTDTFDAFTLLFPITGSKDSSSPVNQSVITLRVAGPIS